MEPSQAACVREYSCRVEVYKRCLDDCQGDGEPPGDPANPWRKLAPVDLNTSASFTAACPVDKETATP